MCDHTNDAANQQEQDRRRFGNDDGVRQSSLAATITKTACPRSGERRVAPAELCVNNSPTIRSPNTAKITYDGRIAPGDSEKKLKTAPHVRLHNRRPEGCSVRARMQSACQQSLRTRADVAVNGQRSISQHAGGGDRCGQDVIAKISKFIQVS